MKNVFTFASLFDTKRILFIARMVKKGRFSSQIISNLS